MSAIRVIQRRFCLAAIAAAMLAGPGMSVAAADDAISAKRRLVPVRQEKPMAAKAAMRLQLLMGGATAEDLPRLSTGSSLCTASRGSRGMR